jgi:putative sugar O-methyltransferase
MDAVLALAREHLNDATADATHALPDAGPRWGTLAAWCRQNIASFETAEQAVHFAQRPTGHGGFEARFCSDSLAQMAAKFEARLASEFPDVAPHLSSFAEPDISEPESTLIYNRRRVSSPMFAHIIFMLNCASRIPAMDYVCEIGGGYGAPARLALTNSYCPATSYAIVDLPESLFFAEVYLRATLGHARVRYLGRDEAIDCRADRFRGVILCPTSRIDGLRPTCFDLITNTLSMQEMTDAYVDFYRAWLSCQPGDYFYSYNYFLQSADDRIESANVFAPRLSEHWQITWSHCEDKRPTSSCHVLAKRSDPLKAKDRNRKTIDRHLKRPLEADSIYPLLHAAQTQTDARFAYALMTALVEDLDFGPKEIFFLADLIARDPALTSEEHKIATGIRANSAARLAAGTNSRVPPHLTSLQRDLYPHRTAVRVSRDR